MKDFKTSLDRIGKKTIKKIKSDVYSEEFLIAFTKMLEKFVNEYADMSEMKVINQAKELLKTINE